MFDAKYASLSTAYKEFGFQARKIVMAEFAAYDLLLRRIRSDDLANASRWQNRVVDWDWEQLMHNARTNPRRIDVALYTNQELCGLALGKVSKGKMYARIDRLERAPSPNRLKGHVGSIAIRYLEVVGGIAGCQETVIVEPADDLLDFYREFGYEKEVRIEGKLWGLTRPLTLQPDQLP